MNYIAVANQIRALAYVAEVEAMKAANAERESKGLAQAYGDDEFLYIARELHELAQSTLENGWQK